MSPIILKVLLLANDIQVAIPEPKVDAPQAVERGVDYKGKMKSKVMNCYPWFPENNYRCPSAKDKK